MRSISVATLCALLAPACQKADAQRGDRGEEALGAKMNLYVQCVNNVSRQVFQGRDGFVRHGEAPKPIVPALADRCASGIERAAGMRPPLPGVEEAALGYARELARVRPLLADATRRDALAAAWDDFAAADAALRRELDRVQREIDARELARLEQGGGLEFHSKRVVARGEAMVRAFAEAEGPPDRAALSRLVDEYVAAHAGLASHLAAHPATSEQVMGPHAAFSASARSLVEHGRAIAAGEASAGEVVDEYNRMVSYWNMLTWKR